MDLRLKQLRTVVAVAEERSFTRAGERLRLSQQSASALVREFEQRLGTALFVRTTRSVEPTPACDALVAEIRPALQLIDAALDRARSGRRERPLVVAISPSLAYGELGLLLESLEQVVGTGPEFRESWGDDIGPGLADGRFDAAICLESLAFAGLEKVPWRRYRIDLLVSAAHRFAQRSEVSVRELDNRPRGDRIAETIRSAGAHVELRDAPRVAGPAPIAVERGDAATIWLTGMQDRYLPEGLARVPLRDPETWVASSLIFLARNGSSAPGLSVLREAMSRTSNIRVGSFTGFFS